MKSAEKRYHGGHGGTEDHGGREVSFDRRPAVRADVPPMAAVERGTRLTLSRRSLFLCACISSVPLCLCGGVFFFHRVLRGIAFSALRWWQLMDDADRLRLTNP